MLSKYGIFKLKMLIEVKKNDATPLWWLFQTSAIKETGEKENLSFFFELFEF